MAEPGPHMPSRARPGPLSSSDAVSGPPYPTNWSCRLIDLLIFIGRESDRSEFNVCDSKFSTRFLFWNAV